MKKIVRLTESDLIRIVKRVINESDVGENSYDECNVNISKGTTKSDIGEWGKMDENAKNRILEKIKIDSYREIKKSIEEYKKWFKDPLTLKKFNPEQRKIVRSSIDPYLDKINLVNLSFDAPRPGVVAWVNTGNRRAINLCIPQIHNGKNYIGSSLYELMKHEIGHLIDYHFKDKKISTYINTIDTSTPESYNANYLINDKDQYTRLNFLRGVIGAGPSDSPSVLLKKFMNKVDDGTISSNKFNFKGGTKNEGMVKPDLSGAKKINRLLRNSIFVNNKVSGNIDQLFSNFGEVSGSDIFISFDMIANLNITSKEYDKKFYYLRLSNK